MTDQPLTAGDLRRALEELPDDTPVRALTVAPSADHVDVHVLTRAVIDQLTVAWGSDLRYRGRPYLRLDLRLQQGPEHRALTEPAGTPEHG